MANRGSRRLRARVGGVIPALLEPDLPAPLTLATLLAGRAPALEAVLDFVPEAAPEVVAHVRARQAPGSVVPYYGTVPAAGSPRGR